MTVWKPGSLKTSASVAKNWSSGRCGLLEQETWASIRVGAVLPFQKKLRAGETYSCREVAVPSEAASPARDFAGDYGVEVMTYEAKKKKLKITLSFASPDFF
jgi:hypothetical protein